MKAPSDRQLLRKVTVVCLSDSIKSRTNRNGLMIPIPSKGMENDTRGEKGAFHAPKDTRKTVSVTVASREKV